MAAAKIAKPKKPRAPKAETPHAELHKDYVDAALRGMWGRTTNLHALQGMHAAKISKAVRTGTMPLPDGTMPSPADVERIIGQLRRNAGRAFTLAFVPERWQAVVDEMTFGKPPTGERTYRRDPDPVALTAEDLR